MSCGTRSWAARHASSSATRARPRRRAADLADVPEVVIDLIDRPKERPWGAGEPTAAVVPSAISNAIADAVGVRVRSVPFTPDKVKAALART